MLANLSGWHLVILIVIMLVIVAVIAAVVVAILAAVRRANSPSTAQRLQQLDELRVRGVVSEVEYAQKREQILREL